MINITEEIKSPAFNTKISIKLLNPIEFLSDNVYTVDNVDTSMDVKVLVKLIKLIKGRKAAEISEYITDQD